MGHGNKAGFELGDDHLGGGEQGWRQVGAGQGGVGTESDDDLVLPLVVDEDGGGAGGVAGFWHEAGGDAVFAIERLGHARERVGAHRSDEKRACTGATSGDGLIGTLAARAGGERADCSLAGGGKRGAAPSEILHITADDDDGGAGRGDHSKS